MLRWRDREVRVGVELRVNLDEIHVERDERIHPGPRLGGIACEEVRDGNVATLEVRPRRDNSGAHEPAGADVAAPRRKRRPVARHVAHPCDAVRDVQPEQLAPARNGRVNVHVPEARDEVLASAIHDSCAGRNACCAVGVDTHDAVPADDHRLLRSRDRIRTVHDRDVCERHGCLRPHVGGERERRSNEGRNEMTTSRSHARNRVLS